MLYLGSVINDVTQKPTQVAINLEVEKKNKTRVVFKTLYLLHMLYKGDRFAFIFFQIINLVFLNRENGERIIIISERQRMLYAYSTIWRMRSVHQ